MHLDMAPDGPYLNRQLQETRAEVRQLEDALKAEREGRQSPNPGLYQSSGLVNDLFDSRGFDVTLKAFRWHLAYCTPGFAASIQTDPTFDLEELFDRVADSFDLQYRTKPARAILPKWPPCRLVETSLEYFSSNRLYSIHPVVDIDALTYLLNTSDLDASGIATNVAARACLAALTAMITRIRRQEPAFADADPDAYVQAVLSMSPQLMMEHTNVRALEALIILVSQCSPKLLHRPCDCQRHSISPRWVNRKQQKSYSLWPSGSFSIWVRTELERIMKLPPRSNNISACGLCSGPCMPWIKKCRFENVNLR